MRIAAEACRDILLRPPCILLHLALSLAHTHRAFLLVCARSLRARHEPREPSKAEEEMIVFCMRACGSVFVAFEPRGIWCLQGFLLIARPVGGRGVSVCIEVLDESAIRPRVAWRVVNRFDYQTLLIVCYTLAHRTTNKYMQRSIAHLLLSL